MASYKQIGENKYKIYVELGYDDNGKRIRKTKTVIAKSERALKKAITELEVEAREQTGDTDNITFERFYKEMFVPLYLEKQSVSTQKNYQFRQNYFLDYFGGMQMRKIKPLHIEKFFDEEEKAGRKSASMKYKCLKSVFERAVQWEVLEVNPVKKVKSKKSEKRTREIYAYDAEQLKELFYALAKHNNKKLSLQVKLASLCGMRLGEIAGLTVETIDFKNNTITIDKTLQFKDGKPIIQKTKTGEVRIIKIPKILIAELKIYVLGVKKLRIQAADIWEQAFDLEGNKITFLFSNTMGKPNHNINIQESWKRFINYKTNLPYLNFHGLRHTCATLLIQSGANINAVKELLGHSDISMTINKYTHMNVEDIGEALKKFDEIL